jgi:hypothetical protein
MSLTTSDHQLYNVTPLKTPFRLLIPLLQSQPHVTTIIHNYFLRCVTFTQLIILHVPNPYSICHTVLLTHLTSSHFPCLSPIETALVEQLLNNWLVGLLLKNWLLRHSSSSYITLNRTSVTVARKGCLRSVSEQRARWGLCYVTRGNAKVTWYSPTRGAVWRHGSMLRRNRIPILLRDVIASARKSCLPAGA